METQTAVEGASISLGAVHFVGFRDDRYWNAIRVFGMPDFIHLIWDHRAARELAKEDIIIFATGEHDQSLSQYNGNDLDEK